MILGSRTLIQVSSSLNVHSYSIIGEILFGKSSYTLRLIEVMIASSSLLYLSYYLAFMILALGGGLIPSLVIIVLSAVSTLVK